MQEGLSPTGLDRVKTRSPGLKTRPDKDWVQFLSISKTNRCHAKVINVQVPEKEGLFTIPTLFTHKLQLAKTLPPQLLKAGLHLAKQQHAKLFQTQSQFPWSSRRSTTTNQTPIRLPPQSTQFFGYRNWHPEHALWDLLWPRSRTLSSSTISAHVSKSLLPDRADWIGAWSAGIHGNSLFDH